MAYLNGLLGAVSEPTGMWISIIKAFEGAVGNYVVAIILLTVVIKVIWSAVELLMKWNQRKMTSVQARMQPELDKIAQKYQKQPQVLQQKQNEVRNKYMGKSQTGSCVIMLVVMVLNMVIFFTLFSGLNGMASYKSANTYETTKYAYANCLNVTDKYITANELDSLEALKDFENISFEIKEDQDNYTAEGVLGTDGVNEKYIVLSYNGEEKHRELYTTDFSFQQVKLDAETGEPVIGEDGEVVKETVLSNTVIVNLINKYFPRNEEGTHNPEKDVVLLEESEEILYRSLAIQNAIMPYVVEVYDANQDSFLWIKNIWVADSALHGPITDFGTVVSQIGADNVEAGEDVIYSAFMADLGAVKGGANGYFILPILCILVAFLTNVLTDVYNKHKYKKDLEKGKNPAPPQKSGKLSKILMPVLLGFFALLYNSVFAIYMLIGQVVSMILLVPQLMIVDKIIEKSEAKKQEKETVVVDYSRKF